MARKRARAKMNIPMCLAGVLFCLTLFSFHLSSGVIARYSATTDGADSARVIEFGKIALTGQTEDKLIVYPGAKLSWDAAVSFEGSESATYVFLEVKPKDGTGWTVSGKTYSALEGKMTWEVADGWTPLGDEKYPHVFYRALGPNTELKKEDTPVVKGGVITVTEMLTAAELANMTAADFDLDFTASVVQSNGFDGPEAAWKSLEAKNKT